MAMFEMSARRLILAGGFALAVAAAPAVAAVAVPTAGPGTNLATDCVGGEEEDLYTGECLPHTVPNSPFTTNAANPDIPEINGVPCTGRNSGECIGLSEDAGPVVVPESTVSSSPTVHGEE